MPGKDTKYIVSGHESSVKSDCGASTRSRIIAASLGLMLDCGSGWMPPCSPHRLCRRIRSLEQGCSQAQRVLAHDVLTPFCAKSRSRHPMRTCTVPLQTVFNRNLSLPVYATDSSSNRGRPPTKKEEKRSTALTAHSKGSRVAQRSIANSVWAVVHLCGSGE